MDLISTGNYVTSMEVAEMVGKDHNKLLRDIREYCTQLSLSNLGQSDFFTESTYHTDRGKEYPCYNVTKKGCEFIANKLTGQKGTEFTAKYVTKFNVMESTLMINRSELPQEMQMFYILADNQAKQFLEQKRQAEQIKAIEQTVSNIKEVMTAPIGDWRAEINAKVREIAMRSNIDYQTLFNTMYGELEQTAHCSLKRLCDNKRERMEKAGNTKTAIKSETTKIAIIESKPQLKAIFESIVRRYAMRYCA